jgi:hypothetical protein
MSCAHRLKFAAIQPGNPDLMWYEFKGRSTDAHVCDSEVFIFVDDVTPITGR